MEDRAPVAVAIAVAAGLCGAVQPKINAELGTRLGSAIVASLVNFAVALACAVVAVALRPTTRRRLVAVREWQVPWWTMTAGLGGVLIVVAGVVAVEEIGVAIFSVAVFAGQIVCGLVVDRLGVAPGGKRPVSAPRVWAVVLAIAAVLLSQLGRPVGEFVPALVAFVVFAGAASAFQAAFNGRITSVTGDGVAATAINVVVGTVVLGGVVAVMGAAGGLAELRWPAQPWLYAGGALGVSIVLSLALATAAIGVLRTTVAMLAAQLIGAFAVDWAVGHDPPTVGVIAGAVLVVVAVALVGRQRQKIPVSG